MKRTIMWHRISAVIYVILMARFAYTGFTSTATIVFAFITLVLTIYGTYNYHRSVNHTYYMNHLRETTKACRKKEDEQILFEIEKERRVRNNMAVASRVA